MARMSIDDKVGRDPRITLLALALGWSKRELVGCLVLDVWPLCYDQESALVSERIIDAAAGHQGFAAAMIEAELATRDRSGKLRITGAAKRIAYLDHQKKSGREGGLKSAALRGKDPKGGPRPGGATLKQPSSDEQGSGNPSVPDPVPDSASAPDPAPAPDGAPDLALAPEPPRRGTRGACDPEREKMKSRIVSKIGPEHAKAFARVKQAIGSTAMGPSVVDSFTELKALLDSLPSLADAEERCRHVLAVREAEAVSKKTVQYFGSTMWKRASFDKALALEMADVDGTRSTSRGGGDGLDYLAQIANGERP
jgi:hypothetical protein